MKKRNLFITTLLVVVAATVAFVSCKKETPDALLNNSQPVKTFTVPQIDDMNAYLKGFKQKMKESQNAKDAEYLSLEEAAWHLSSVANYDFANANVEYADIRFDTLYTQISITNNAVLLSDLNTTYAALSSAIDSYLQGITLENANIRFVDVTISESGEVTMILATTFDWGHTWYYEDVFDAMLHCSEFFTEPSGYYANGFGRSELERALNLVESHLPSAADRVYYTTTRAIDYTYPDYIDPYGSPSYLQSRLFASSTSPNPDLIDNMCYYFDSYLGLGYDSIQNNECIIQWLVSYDTETPPHYYISFHKLRVRYGIVNIIEPEQPGGAE